jgi:hypothetical protein
MRNSITLRYQVGGRTVEVRAYDAVGVEDIYSVLLRGVLHRFMTGEQLIEPVPRDVKDWLLRLNLSV